MCDTVWNTIKKSKNLPRYYSTVIVDYNGVEMLGMVVHVNRGRKRYIDWILLSGEQVPVEKYPRWKYQ